MDLADWQKRRESGLTARTRRVVKDKQTIVVNNIQTDPETWSPDWYKKQGLMSAIIVPLVVKDEVIGLLNLYTHEEHAFTEEEIEFLTTLSGQAGLAVYNAQLSSGAEGGRRILPRLSESRTSS
jgi:GAF domain-containing protein